MYLWRLQLTSQRLRTVLMLKLDVSWVEEKIVVMPYILPYWLVLGGQVLVMKWSEREGTVGE